MGKLIRQLIADRTGGTAIEYGLIAALVVIAMIASLGALANQTVGMWGNVSNKVTTANGG
ncbi:MAG: Flp family type IVb pilin [Sphingomonas sp.]|uniref:Flp family type IVb pilin n=1 Tax=Sphingomonas sp. TaxID=28214 RepID=UPI0025E3EA41|nr:Flp family type IVb pilin [Sphingomonas sp.]MBY0283848.1 Flp family type IVb pilin [Sphingomonas sp.]